MINNWPTDQVDKANGLRAVWVNNANRDLFSEIQFCLRAPFVHTWDVRAEERILSVAKQYLFTIFKDNKNTVEQRNFEMRLDDFFPDGKNALIRKKIYEEWYRQS